MAIDLQGAMQKRYDLLRSRANQDVATQGQEASSALQRRQAQLGNLNSGAAIKQQQVLGDKVAEQKQKANEGIDIAQSGEQAQLEQVKQGQEFASGEALKGREFAGLEAEKGRGFSSSERLAAQTFGSSEADKQRGFMSGESKLQRDQQSSQFDKSFGLQERQLKSQEEEAAINKASLAYDALRNAMQSDDPNAEKLPLAGFYASIGLDPNQAFNPIDRQLQTQKDREGRRNNLVGGLGAGFGSIGAGAGFLLGR